MRHESFYVHGTHCDEELGLYLGWVGQPGSCAEDLPLTSPLAPLKLFFHGEHHGDDADSGPSGAKSAFALLAKQGLEALPNLNGWFHGVLTNAADQTITVFNDRYGMQRLHIAREDDDFIFASEAGALLKILPDLKSLDSRAVGEFLSCGCVLDGRSLFTKIATLPAGTAWQFRNATLTRQGAYFRSSQWESQPIVSSSEFERSIQNHFPRALARCLNSNLPFGISLTGGYDTRMMMAWLPSQQAAKTTTYTFGGMYRDCFDVKIARRVASICGSIHRVFPLGEEFLKQFPALASQTIRLSDGCLGATNAYELYLNRLARQVAPVRLTGSYGSEVMRGARAFKAIRPTQGLMHSDFLPQIENAIRHFQTFDGDHPVSFSVFRQAPWYYYNRLAVEQSQVIIRTPYMDNDLVGLVYRRPDAAGDTRKPLRRLIAQGNPRLAALPTDTGNSSYLYQKWVQFLFKADYCYKSGMPQWLEKLHHNAGPLSPETLLIGRHRFAHYRVWFRHQLAPYVREILLDPRTAARPYFNARFVEQMVQQHTSGVRNYTDEIERVLTIELTCRQFIDGTS